MDCWFPIIYVSPCCLCYTDHNTNYFICITAFIKLGLILIAKSFNFFKIDYFSFCSLFLRVKVYDTVRICSTTASSSFVVDFNLCKHDQPAYQHNLVSSFLSSSVRTLNSYYCRQISICACIVSQCAYINISYN